MDIWKSRSAMVSPGLEDLLVWIIVCRPSVDTHVDCIAFATACSSVGGMLLEWYRVPEVMVSIINLMCCGGVLSCCSKDMICWSVVSFVLATNSLIIV